MVGGKYRKYTKNTKYTITSANSRNDLGTRRTMILANSSPRTGLNDLAWNWNDRRFISPKSNTSVQSRPYKRSNEDSVMTPSTQQTMQTCILVLFSYHKSQTIAFTLETKQGKTCTGYNRLIWTMTTELVGLPSVLPRWSLRNVRQLWAWLQTCVHTI